MPSKRQHSKLNNADFIHSDLPPPLLHGREISKERVKKKEFILHTTVATTKMEKNMLSQPNVTALRVFEYEMDASPSSETIQIYENIHKCIRINFYLSALTLLLSSKFVTPFWARFQRPRRQNAILQEIQVAPV